MANMLETMPSVGTAAPGQDRPPQPPNEQEVGEKREPMRPRDTATVIGEFSNGNRYPL